MRLLLIIIAFISSNSFGTTILFLGDSLTEGYQLSKEEAYPAIVERVLTKKKKKVKIINGGVSGATSASGPQRLDWYLKAKPDILVLALGANDGLRGLKVQETKKNLSLVIEKSKERGVTVILAGMKMPTNMGESYRIQFEKIYPEIAQRYGIKLIPFLLEGVGGKSQYNLSDGIHPNSKGHEIIAQIVLNALEPLL